MITASTTKTIQIDQASVTARIATQPSSFEK
jgi:hypothetical protein